MKSLALALALVPFCAVADEEFTPAQLAKIERMMQLDRGRLREEIIAEIARNPGLLEGKKTTPEIEDPVIPATTGDVGASFVREAEMREAGRVDTGLRSSAAPLDLGFAVEARGKPAYKFQIEFNEDKASAAIGISGASDAINDTDSMRYRQTTWELILSRPIKDDDKGAVDFATLDGLSSGLRLDYRYSWRHSNLGGLIEMTDSSAFDALCDRLVPGGSTSCSTSSIQKALGEDSAEYRAFKRQYYPWIVEHSFGLQAGYDTYRYLTPQLQKSSDSHQGYGASFETAFVSPSREWLFALGAKYQRGHESNDEVVLCPPGNGVDPVQCISGSLGAPSEATRKLLWGEVRGSFGDFGYSLKATHDLESDETGVNLPIYFVRNNDGDLTGGLRLGWTDEQHFGAGIFISKPFKLK